MRRKMLAMAGALVMAGPWVVIVFPEDRRWTMDAGAKAWESLLRGLFGSDWR